jgi:hypothetical protein
VLSVLEATYFNPSTGETVPSACDVFAAPTVRRAARSDMCHEL